MVISPAFAQNTAEPAKGFYKYSAQEAKRWEERFLKFTYDIRALALKYPDRSNNPKSDARRR